MKLSALLYYTDLGRFSPAPFSRPFSWTQHQVTSLFTSLYRGWPIGEIVLWTRPQGLANTRMNPAPEMIVDGAQRITAIYAAIRGRKPFFTLPSEVVSCPLRFHVMREEFAVYHPSMIDDRCWIELTDLFERESPALGEILASFYESPPTGISQGEVTRRLSRLAGIADLHLAVQYMPSEASEGECHDFYQLIHRRGI